ncbi:hypothetical protein AAY473_009989 [Plecturocebus cupreus]
MATRFSNKEDDGDFKKNYFLREALLSPRLECSGSITAHCSFNLLCSSNSPTLTCRIVGTRETGSYYVTQAGLELLRLSNLSTSTSQNAGATGASHHAQPINLKRSVSMFMNFSTSVFSFLGTKIDQLPVSADFPPTPRYLHHGPHLFLQALAPRSVLEYSGVISGHCSLRLLGSSNSPASDSLVAGITSVHHHAWLIFVLLVETAFHHVGQAGLKLPTSGHPPAAASHTSGITGVSNHIQRVCFSGVRRIPSAVSRQGAGCLWPPSSPGRLLLLC